MANLLGGTIVFGDATVQANLHANGVFTDSLYFSNGQPYVVSGGGSGVSGVSSNSFVRINVGSSILIANSNTSQLNFVAGNNVTLLANTLSNTIIISMTSTKASVLVDMLAVGGGGGGSSGLSGLFYGSAGAGGVVRTGSFYINPDENVNISIGAGGLGEFASVGNAYSGGDTMISKPGTTYLLATGGQGARANGDGGSNADYSGGTGLNGTQASGGAGAGGNGGNGSAGNSNGGVGVTSSITGTSIYYGGGGGGGPGGTGGTGGGGGMSTDGTNGLGGGAGGHNSTGYQSGGSGVAILRYKSSYPLFSGGNVTSFLSGSDTYQVHTFTIDGSFIGLGLQGVTRIIAGNNITVSSNGVGDVVINAVGGGSSSNSFSTVNVDGYLLTANTPISQLNLVSGSNITLTPNQSTNTITISATGGGTTTGNLSNSFSTVSVNGTKLTANTPTSQINFVAGSNITLTPDQSSNTITISSTGGGGGGLTVVNWSDIANTNNVYGPNYVNIGHTAGSKADETIAIGPNSGATIGRYGGPLYSVTYDIVYGADSMAAFGQHYGAYTTNTYSYDYVNIPNFNGRRVINTDVAVSYPSDTGYHWLIVGSYDNTYPSKAGIIAGREGYVTFLTSNTVSNTINGNLLGVVQGANNVINTGDYVNVTRHCAVGTDGAGSCLILMADQQYVNVWTQQAIGTFSGHLNSITYCYDSFSVPLSPPTPNNKFIAVGQEETYPDYSTFVLTSNDAITWSKTTIDLFTNGYDTYLNDIAVNPSSASLYGNTGPVIAVGYDGTNTTSIIIVSNDAGNTWNLTSNTDSIFQNVKLNRVYYDAGINNKFIAIGRNDVNDESVLLSSTNGIYWTKETTFPGATIYDISIYGYYSSLYATVVGSDSYGTTAIYTSNLSSWPNFVRRDISSQSNGGVAVGSSAGQGQGPQTVAVGIGAGQYNQGWGAVAIGAYAGRNQQMGGSIAINASSSDLDAFNQGLYINPVRPDLANTTQSLFYDMLTHEITFADSDTIKIPRLTNGANTVNLESSGVLTIPGTIQSLQSTIKTTNGFNVSSNVWLGSSIGLPTLSSTVTMTDSGTNSTTVTGFTAVANSVILVASGSETAALGSPATITGITGLGLTWTQRSIYLDPNSPRNQQSEIWYAINDTTSPITDDIVISFDNTFDDQATIVSSYINCNLVNPWSNNTPYYSNNVDISGAATVTMSTSQFSTAGIVFFASPTSTPGYAVGWTDVNEALNGGGTYWQDADFSYKQFTTPQTNLVVTSGLTPGNTNGLTVIADALVGVGDPDSTKVVKTWEFGANGNIVLPSGGDILRDGTSVLGGGSGSVYDANTTSTGFFAIPKGNTAERPINVTDGMMRVNQETGYAEIYLGNNWVIFAKPGISVDYLIVGGGGGGGGAYGGGGGAGGLLYGSTSIIKGSNNAIIVGSGGSAGAGASGQGGTGGVSSGLGFTAYGGGGGGGNAIGGSGLGATGGSGGGGGAWGGVLNSGGGGLSGQGNAGGTGASDSPYTSGGGGGAGGAGNAGNSAGNGNGGAGYTWLDGNTYAGGGGGGGQASTSSGAGQGGSGGGGLGGYNGVDAVAGTSNTGGGGGGGRGSASTGAAGGSGIVIIRYPEPQRMTGGTVTTSSGYVYHTYTTNGYIAYT